MVVMVVVKGFFFVVAAFVPLRMYLYFRYSFCFIFNL